MGGGVQVALAVLEHASREAGEWHAVLSPEVDREAALSVKRALRSLHVLGSSSALSELVDAAVRLPGIERAIRPDVVFTIFGPTLWRSRAPQLVGFAQPSLLYPEVRLRASLRGALAKRWQRFRMRRTRDWVVETETVRGRMTRILGIPRAAIRVVPNSVSPEFQQACRRGGSGGAVEGRRSILVPSSYYPHKNLELVPRVARALCDRGLADHVFRLTVASDEAWRRILAAARGLGVADQVENLGHVPHREFAALYADADLVFLPTRLECSTAVYPESFCAGKPVVTSDLDFARELCLGGALYFDPDDAEQAASAILEVVADAATRERVVRGGSEALRANYPSPEEKWRMQLGIMRELAARSAAGREREAVRARQ